MKYCCTNNERQGSCYFEFQKGRFSEEFWRDDSLYLTDDDFNTLGLYEIFISVLPSFDYYGITEVTREQWEQIVKSARKTGGEVEQAIEEIHCWVQRSFQKEQVLTVLGV